MVPHRSFQTDETSFKGPKGKPQRLSLLNNRTFKNLKGIFHQQPQRKPTVEKGHLTGMRIALG